MDCPPTIKYTIKDRPKRTRMLPPMQCLTNVILIASMVVHAIFGCCIHHEHSCEADCCDTLSSAEACSCGGPDDCDPSDVATLDQPDDGEREHSQHAPHQCEGGKCNFARTETSSDGDSLDARSIAAISVSHATCVVLIADRPVKATFFEPFPAFLAPRRHLVLAVFLI